jgi:hypothetical protein
MWRKTTKVMNLSSKVTNSPRKSLSKISPMTAVFSENGSVGGREIELSVEETNIINGTIEDQGISVNSFLSEIGKQLSGESKQMFAGVNF